MTPIELLLSKLPDVKRNSQGWQARCPAHDDRRPSLSIAKGDDGRVLVRCHAGCTTEAVVSALGMSMRDLMPEHEDGSKPAARRGRKPAPKTYPTARAAVAELERRHGKRSAMWTYRDAKGEPVGVIVRWDRPGAGKDIRPVSRASNGWIIGGMPTPKPLYCLPALAKAKRVFVVEGEKACDAVRSLGLTATTSPHGSNSPGTADWSPLAGKECVILPDNDDAGKGYADDVTAILGELSPSPWIKVVTLPDLPLGGDMVEYIAARRAAGSGNAAIRAEVEALVDAAAPIELQRPTPKVGVFKPFPVSALPEPIGSFVGQAARAIGCDPSYVALPMLSALAAAIGNTRRIQLKRGWPEPAILWTAIVGESGTLKTPAFKAVMQPIRDRQNEALKRHAEAVAQYETRKLEYEKELGKWKHSKGGYDEPPEKPEPPQAERYVVSDTTVEALAPILLANPRGVLLARDELAGWIGSFDRYAGGKGGGGGADAAHWLSMHNGEALVVDRKTGPVRTICVPSASVGITGGVQPGVLNRVLGYAHRESGLLARILLAMPPRRRKRWSEAEIPERVEAEIATIFARLYELKPGNDHNGDPRPVAVPLTPRGKRAWGSFVNEHGGEHVQLTGDLAAAWSKLEGYAARLALVVHCVKRAATDPALRADDEAVDEGSIGTGVTLSRWFGQEARRVYAVLGESEENRGQRRLVELIQRKGGSLSIRDWQRGRSHKTAGDAEAELGELVKAGYGMWRVPRQTGAGRPSAKCFVLASDTTDTDTTPVPEPSARVLSVSEVSDDSNDEFAEDPGTVPNNGSEWPGLPGGRVVDEGAPEDDDGIDDDAEERRAIMEIEAQAESEAAGYDDWEEI